MPAAEKESFRPGAAGQSSDFEEAGAAPEDIAVVEVLEIEMAGAGETSQGELMASDVEEDELLFDDADEI